MQIQIQEVWGPGKHANPISCCYERNWKIVSGAMLWNPTCTEAKLPQAGLSKWLEAAEMVTQTGSCETWNFTDMWHWLEDSHQLVRNLLTTVPQSDSLLHHLSFPLSFTGVRPTLLPPPARSPFSSSGISPPNLLHVKSHLSVCFLEDMN